MFSRVSYSRESRFERAVVGLARGRFSPRAALHCRAAALAYGARSGACCQCVLPSFVALRG
eukprot:3581549-Lingulodinium_polyedra.AAC.1